jgi:hypothetical protein
VGTVLRTIWVPLILGALLFSCGESSEDGARPGNGGGGATSSGGVSALGGSPSSGGGSALGGASASGGSTATGGSTTSGGAGEAGAGATGGADEGGSDGAAGSGGEAGSGEAGAAGASGRPLQPVGTIPADKIDLLFVIDNSISMADKQTLLRDAVPLLVQRLVTPVCVDASGTPNGQHARANGTCAAGEPEFPPIRDFHIGVISSSLGSHGGDVCDEAGTSTPNANDRGQLLPSVRDNLTSWNDSGFLAWDPEGRANPTGANDATVLVQDFQDMVVAAGDGGCGYESTLEAWYRFLVDPDPPTTVTRNATLSGVDVVSPNQIVLDQRRAFLRPDSLLGIVVLSDENDCSIMDSGQAFLTGTTTLSAGVFNLPRSTSACAADPNDPCCVSCAVGSAPSGCLAPAEDSECQKGAYLSQEDPINLRC